LCDGEVTIAPVERYVCLRAGQRDDSLPGWARDSVSSCLVREGATLKSYLRSLSKKFHDAGRNHT
jgi:hypothetical protein